MIEIIDVRGLSCPEPVLRTLEIIKKTDKEKLEIIVDTDTSKENIIRMINSVKWRIVEIKKDLDSYRIIISKY